VQTSEDAMVVSGLRSKLRATCLGLLTRCLVNRVSSQVSSATLRRLSGPIYTYDPANSIRTTDTITLGMASPQSVLYVEHLTTR
jgi:hypothetical protein